MSRRRLKTLLLHSISTMSSSPLKSNPLFTTSQSQAFPSPSKFFHQNLKLCLARFLCTSSPDNLDGLVDPHDLSMPGSSGVESISAENSPLCTIRCRQIGYSHTGPVYDALLELLECGSNDRVPEHFLREIKGDDREVLGKLLNVLIRKCCRNGLWNVALEELGRLKDFGYKPTCATYNVLVQVFLKADRLDTAHLVHVEMSDLGFKMDEYTLGCFVHALCKAGRWKEALTLIEKEEFVPNTSLYTKMISGLCEASLFEEAMDFLNRMRLGDYFYAYKLLKKMVKCGCHPGYVVYNILIGGICGNEELPSSDMLDLAEKAYGEMLDAGVVLNKVNVSNFARCLCGARKYEKAFNVIREMMSKGFLPDTSTLCSWFNEMVGNGCAPNVVTYTALIHAYLKAKKVSDANKLFEMMLTEGCIPNVVTYTALIDGHCKAGRIEKACLIYERMRGNVEIPDVDMYFRIDNQSMKEPNVYTYGALVDGLCKAHKVKEARDLLDAMSVEGCEPTHIVYDALIDGFCKYGKLDEAQEVFTKMSEKGYSPNVYTYSSLIDRLFKDKRLDLALKVLSKMLENSCAPNVVIYTEMIDGLCKVGKTDEAYKLMLMMEEKGCYPNVVTYTAMIDGFGKAGKIEKCLELFKEMSSKGCAPNFVTYRVLINHCCSTGLLDEAHKLLDEMKQTYWPKHMVGYHKVIEGYNREFMNSLGILDEMSECGSVSIIHIYRVLIDNFVKAGRLEFALELHDEISSSSPFTSVNKNIYTSLIESLLHANKVGKALELFADMIRQGGIPELMTLFDLIKGLIKINKWDEALQLSDSICQMLYHILLMLLVECKAGRCCGIHFVGIVFFFHVMMSSPALSLSSRTVVSLFVHPNPDQIPHLLSLFSIPNFHTQPSSLSLSLSSLSRSSSSPSSDTAATQTRVPVQWPFSLVPLVPSLGACTRWARATRSKAFF
ncbi:hypothetical protein GBA52_004116 [Prunus armeniaca]|nr:hypothetical protein GBA52_004116 [Prunus armeniaca]